MTKPGTPLFARSLQIGLEETELVLRRYQSQTPEPWRMLDVGAHRGTSTMEFAKQGWRVHAFEPDPSNRALFHGALDEFHNVTVDARAVSDVDGETVTLFDSEESSGISSLLAFSDSHRPAAQVKTVRLDTFAREAGLDRVDFLKVDTEGYDLMVLRGFPWDVFQPDFVLCEYEDRKTNQLGYTSGDLVTFLVDQGYSILVSEWHPIERYGVTHSFAQIRRFEGRVPAASSWGNFLAVRDPDDVAILLADVPNVLQVRAKKPAPRAVSLRFDAWKRSAIAKERAKQALRSPQTRSDP